MRLGMLLGVHDPRRNRDAPNKNDRHITIFCHYLLRVNSLGSAFPVKANLLLIAWARFGRRLADLEGARMDLDRGFVITRRNSQ